MLMIYVAWSHHLDIVKFLVEKSADVESTDHKLGQTPLSWAANHGHLDAVKILVKKVSADVKSCHKGRRTLLSYNEWPKVLKRS